LPWDEDAALAADLHSHETLIEAGNRSTGSLHKWQRLRVGQLGFAIVTHHRLAVFIPERHAMLFGGVEYDSVSCPIAGVEDLIELVWFGQLPCADLDFLVAQGNREDRLLNSSVLRNVSGRLDEGRNQR
jgi:hypothetical protein